MAHKLIVTLAAYEGESLLTGSLIAEDENAHIPEFEDISFEIEIEAIENDNGELILNIANEDGNYSETFDLILTIIEEPNENGIAPAKTVTGNSGYCTIEYLGSANTFYWIIRPNTSASYEFIGTVTVTNASGGIVQTSSIFEYGIGSTSGFVYLNKIVKGTKYTIQLSGTAYLASGGTTLLYTVSPNAYLYVTGGTSSS